MRLQLHRYTIPDLLYTERIYGKSTDTYWCGDDRCPSNKRSHCALEYPPHYCPVGAHTSVCRMATHHIQWKLFPNSTCNQHINGL